MSIARNSFVTCALAVALGGVACSSSSSADDGVAAFPPGFLWGSASAAFQVEKGNSNSDWAAWVEIPGKIEHDDKPSVNGPDAFANMDADVKALVDADQRMYRFSVEWSRIYPTKEDFEANRPNAEAIATYKRLLEKLKAAGIKPMVTLQHFTLPIYFADPSKSAEPYGWERADFVSAFGTFCERMGGELGGLVDYWTTVNEPLVPPLGGYVSGDFPPGLFLAMDRLFGAIKGAARGHVACYDALHRADKVDADGDGKPVLASVAAHQRTFHPNDPTNENDVSVTERVRYLNNLWFLNAIVKGDWDEDGDMSLDGPNDKKADPAMKDKVDYIGVNYYSDTLVQFQGSVPLFKSLPSRDRLPTGRPRTDLQWDIYPEGFETVLVEAAQYGYPIIVTENGLADSTDRNRARFIGEHLLAMGRAMKRGADVRGYLHWSLVDNFEWAEGFCPRFGLYTYDPATGARTARPSVTIFRDWIRAGKVTKADVDKLPAYVAPGASACVK
jgi:beta-glucosidase/6-phospho-beta-glucosidase/beta-galactosidase